MRAFLILILCSIVLFSFGITHAKNLPSKKIIKDDVITSQILAKFAESENLTPLKITVKTTQGCVNLSGDVKNKTAFVEALRLTKAIPGVRSVEAEDLIIKQVNNVITDAYITAKVETAVLKAKVFDDESIPIVGINATTSNGTVTLSGNVRQNKSIVAIIRRVNSIQGVKKIISRLQVSNTDV